MEPEGQTSHLLQRVALDDPQAINELIGHACRRLQPLAAWMLEGFPNVQRWEEADDVLQRALLRIDAALRAVRFESSLHFWNTASWHLRMALIDLARHYEGPGNLASRHHSDLGGRAADDSGGPLQDHPGMEDDPPTLAEWAEFHTCVDELPQGDRALFDLLWYQGLTQPEAAEILGVPLRTLKGRWQDLRAAVGEWWGRRRAGDEG